MNVVIIEEDSLEKNHQRRGKILFILSKLGIWRGKVKSTTAQLLVKHGQSNYLISLISDCSKYYTVNSIITSFQKRSLIYIILHICYINTFDFFYCHFSSFRSFIWFEGKRVRGWWVRHFARLKKLLKLFLWMKCMRRNYPIRILFKYAQL